MGDEKVPCYKDSVLRKSDLGILQGSCELTDEIIGVYFQYPASRFDCDDIKFVSPSVSFWLTQGRSSEHGVENIESMKLHDSNIVISPVTNCSETGDDGTHWSTLVYFRSTNMFVHLDSMQGENNEHATRLYEAVIHVFFENKGLNNNKKNNKDTQPLSKRSSTVPDVPGFVEYEMTPQQSNGYDCGLFVLAIARSICQWHVGWSRGKDADWFSTTKKDVSVSSVEMSMAVEELIKQAVD